MTLGSGGLSGLFSGAGGETMGRGLIRLGVDTSAMRQQVRNGINGVKSEMQRGTAEIQGTGRAWGAAMGVARAGLLTLAAASALGVGILAEASKAAKDFASRMELVHTQAGASAKEVAALSGPVRDLAGVVGFGPSKLADALFHIESAGLRGKAALDLLKIAAEGAQVGQSDLEGTTNALIATITSGIKGTTSFGQSMGVLNAIVGAGNLRMEQLTSALGSGVLTAARTFGVSIQSVGAALADMTRQGIPADEGATRLRMTLSLLGAPSSQAATELARIGLNSTDLAVAMRGPEGILGAISMLKTHLDASKLSLVDQAALLSHAFGGGRSSAALLALLGDLKNFRQIQDQITKGTNTFGEAWAATTQQAEFQQKRLGAAWDAALVRLGQKTLPGITNIFKTLADAIAPAEHVAEQLLDGISAGIAKVAPSVGYLLDGLGKLGGAIISIFTGQNKPANWGGVVKTIFDGLVTSVGFLAKHLGDVAHFFAAVFSNQLIANATKLLVLLAGARLAIDGIMAVGRGLTGAGGAGRGFVNWLTFGAAGGGRAAAAATPEGQAAQAMEKAAGSHEGAAKALTAAAEKLGVAGEGVAVGRGIGPAMPGGWNPSQAEKGMLNYVLPPAVGGGPGLGGQAIELGSKEAQLWQREWNRAWSQSQLWQLQPPTLGGIRQAGRNIVSAAGNAIGSAASAVRTGGGLAARGLGAIAGIAGKLFWPAMIASFAIDLAAAPIGGFVANNLGLKNLGAEMSTDLLGGIGTWLTSVFSGVDVEKIANLKVKEFTVGGTTVTAVDAAKMGMSRAQIEEIFTDNLTVAGAVKRITTAQTQLEADLTLPTADTTGLAGARALQQFGDSLRAQAEKYGLHFDDLVAQAVKAGLPAPTTTRLGTEYDPALLQYIANQVRQKAEGGIEDTIGALRDSVATQLKAFGFKPGDIAAMTDAQVEQIAVLLSKNTNGQYDAWFNSVLQDVRGKLEGHTPTITTPSTITVPGHGTHRVPPLDEGARVPGAGSSAYAANQQQVANMQKAFATLQANIKQNLDGAGYAAAAGEDFIAKYTGAITRGLQKATTDKQREAIAKQLGFKSWAEFLAGYNNAVHDTGQDQLVNIATGLSHVLTIATKNGFDGAKDPTNKASLQMLTAALNEGNLAPAAEAAIRKVLRQAAAGQLIGELPVQFKSVGAALLKDVSTGASDAQTQKDLTTAVNAAIKAGARLDPETIALLQALGYNIPAQIATGINQGTVEITTAVAGAMSYIGKHLPQSPVQMGPLKHPFLPTAGRKIMEQIAGGMQGYGGLTIPGLTISAMAREQRGLRAQAGGGQTINIDRLYANGADDEFSIGARLAFMAPGAR